MLRELVVALELDVAVAPLDEGVEEAVLVGVSEAEGVAEGEGRTVAGATPEKTDE